MGFQETFNARVIPAAERAFGVLVMLTHGEKVSEEFTALKSSGQYEIADEEGFVTTYRTTDFEFAKEDVAALGVMIEPRRGDRLRLTQNGTAETYELIPVGSIPAVEEKTGGYRWLVHTKQVN